MKTKIALLLALLLAACRPENSDPADLILTNAVIWTGIPGQASAEAIAVKGDRILAVGDTLSIKKHLGPETKVIDAKGGFVTPGFIDCHVHFLNGGLGLSSIQLRDAETPEEFARRFREYAAGLPPGSWILEGNWDHEQWGGELPDKAWIDEFTADNPVFVQRLDGHMALANSAALKAAGITKTTKEVFGGTIVRDAAGEPTGILKDNAMSLVYSVVPDPTPEQEDRAMQAAMQFVASHGVTSVHNMDPSGIQALDPYKRVRESGGQITRFYVALGLRHWQDLEKEIAQHGRGDEWLKIGVLKAMIDGSLGSHTAAFFEPFTDAPADTGLFVNRPDSLYQWIKGADAAGLQVAVHAIGDKAIHEVLDAFERAAEQNGPKDRRFRIEHAQHIAPADIPRFAGQQVIASMQPYHAIDDGRWAEKVIGPDRIKTTYAFRSLLDAGATVAFGSDWFVAPPTPLEGIYAAVTRRTLDEANPAGWVPEQKVTVEEALKAYTLDAAYAAFEEGIKGSLEPGKLADLVLLDRDIRAIPPEEIRRVQVMRTIVGGKTVFERESYSGNFGNDEDLPSYLRGRDFRRVDVQVHADNTVSLDGQVTEIEKIADYFEERWRFIRAGEYKGILQVKYGKDKGSDEGLYLQVYSTIRQSYQEERKRLCLEMYDLPLDSLKDSVKKSKLISRIPDTVAEKERVDL